MCLTLRCLLCSLFYQSREKIITLCGAGNVIQGTLKTSCVVSISLSAVCGPHSAGSPSDSGAPSGGALEWWTYSVAAVHTPRPDKAYFFELTEKVSQIDSGDR